MKPQVLEKVMSEVGSAFAKGKDIPGDLARNVGVACDRKAKTRAIDLADAHRGS
jgi:hypothetical protein